MPEQPKKNEPKSEKKQKPTESKESRFKRLATHRTKQVLTKLKVLSNCSSGVTYSYTPAQVEQIFTSIQAEVDRVHALFTAPKREEKKESDFVLS